MCARGRSGTTPDESRSPCATAWYTRPCHATTWWGRAHLFLPVLVIAAGVGAYLNSFDGVFVLDDQRYIGDNLRIRQLWPPEAVLSGRRPVVDLSLAINYAGGELELGGYHAVNLIIHLLAALTLYGIVRRTLLGAERWAGCGGGSDSALRRRWRLRTGFEASPSVEASSWIAWVTALIWVVHPLQTQSVTYLIQRCESMMGLFYLLTVYCVIRGAEGGMLSRDEVAGNHVFGSGSTCLPPPAAGEGMPPAGQCAMPNLQCPIRNAQSAMPNPQRFVARWWYVAAVICCALGMGSKGVMVTAPMMVLLYDRVFISGSWSRTLRRRWALYVGLAATWSVLWACGIVRGVLDPSRKVATVGFAFKEITPVEYALTQPGVILHYLLLSLWPHPLCLDYAWPVARTAEAILLPLLVLVALCIGAVWAFFRRPCLGFLGAWFFVILAPTASVIPIRDPLFEHRMYLSLAALVVLVVMGGWWVLRHLAGRLSMADALRRSLTGVLLLTVIVSLGYGTIRRNEAYQSAVSMWRDVVAKRPLNHRGHYNLGTSLLDEDELERAIPAFRRALELNPRLAKAHYNLGKALQRQGKADEALWHYADALQIDPSLAEAHSDLGNILARRNRVEEAIAHYRQAVRVNPAYVRAYYNLGSVLLNQGKTEEAVEVLRQAMRLSPQTTRIHYALGNALLKQGSIEEAVRRYQETLRLDPDHIRARLALEAALGQRNHSAQP